MFKAVDFMTMASFSYSDSLADYKTFRYDFIQGIHYKNDYFVLMKSEKYRDLTIVFRGSNDSDDWWSNLNFWSEHYNEFGRVHGGFVESYLSLRVDLWRLLSIHLKQDFKINIVGHSRGGALAELCALDIAQRNPNEIRLYTFGSPRVGQNTYKARFKACENIIYERYVNGRDPVPTIPWSFKGFRHVAPEIHLKERTWGWPIIGNVKHHTPQRYLRNLL